ELVMETAVGDLDDEQIDTLIMQLRQRALEARSAPPTLLASPEPVKEPVPPAAETSAPDGAKEKWNDEPRHYQPATGAGRSSPDPPRSDQGPACGRERAGALCSLPSPGAVP